MARVRTADGRPAGHHHPYGAERAVHSICSAKPHLPHPPQRPTSYDHKENERNCPGGGSHKIDWTVFLDRVKIGDTKL